MRSPVKWHGGKSYLARRIIAGFPDHATYCEPFCGALNVLLNRPKAEVEIAGDLNFGLIKMWATLRDHPAAVIEACERAEYDAETFAAACRRLNAWPPPEPAEHAAAFIVRNRFSRGGLGKTFAWSDRLRGGRPGDANAWRTIVADLPMIAHRIRDVTFLERDAISVIEDADAPGTLFYCDPPYVHGTRTARGAYDHEMSDGDHRRLLEALLGCRGRAFVSGYACELYDGMLAGWRRHEFDLPNHSSQAKVKARRTEVLWEKP